MARRAGGDDGALDRLYQLPLAEFVAARNALARQAGPEGASIRQLAKPALAAWAINQLYWRERSVYQDLLGRAADLRATHAAAARGRSPDLRGAVRAHEEAVGRALKATLSLAAAAGHPVTDAARQAIVTTLRSLPAEGPHGRLTRPIEPQGFEALAGPAVGGRVRASSGAKASHPARAGVHEPAADKGSGDTRGSARLAAARSAADAATHAVRGAEQAWRRDAFEAARAEREVERAGRRLQQAREALDAAQAALEEAERAAAAATHARDAARARASQSDERVATTREQERLAREAVDQLSHSHAT